MVKALGWIRFPLAALMMLTACSGSGTGGAAGSGARPTTTSGGAAANGGAPSGGGASANTHVGGSGVASAGGATAIGGSSANSGAATGGSPSAGACSESTCGSHKWPCWKMPNPASSPASVPNHQSYTDLGAGGSGAVRDNITCLVWEKVNPATQGNWQASYDRCAALATSNFAGFSDWRLPTRVEMASITDLHGSNGFASIFTVTGGYYTTDSDWYETITGQNTSGFIWGYGANGFTSNAVAGGGTNLVARCVRGNGTGEAVNAFAVEPPNHYTVTGTGTDAIVRDNYTGLTWEQTYSAQMAWADAATYCAGRTTAGLTGWRVPTLNELASTVNEALVGGAINRTVFPNNPNGCGATYWFWSSNVYYSGTGVYWGLSYCDGFTGWNSLTDTATWNDFSTGYVRCVR